MPYYRSSGDVPAKRHTVHTVGGDRAHEELMGEDGFSGPSTLLYHRHSPAALLAIEAVETPDLGLEANLPVRPHHLRTTELSDAPDANAVEGRLPLLANGDLRLSYCRFSLTSPLYRDAVGDELAYLHRGEARLETQFGSLSLREGDYAVIPRGAVHRWLPESPCEVLFLEATGHVRIPARYLTAEGQLREGSPYSERDVRGPEGGPPQVDAEAVPVLVRTQAGLTRHILANHPFDVVGWDGCIYPWAFSIHDFEPIVGRIHQPPPVHQTFAGDHFVVCSFVPRPYDFDPSAVKIPYHHANVASDEVLFYAGGDFMSRSGSGIGAGSISVHPAGFVHGPQPGSYERSLDATRTEELAVMVDTFRPLELTRAARSISDPDYPRTWLRPTR